MENLCSHALLNNQFYQDRLVWFDFKIPSKLPEAKSLIIVTVPRPQTQPIFGWNGRRCPLIIPPTYTAEEEIEQQVKDLISKILRKKVTE